MDDVNVGQDDDEIERGVAEQTLSLVLDIASTRMLKSLVEIGYLSELYSQEEYDKLHDAQENICKQLLSEIFGDSQTIDEEEFEQKIGSYKFL